MCDKIKVLLLLRQHISINFDIVFGQLLESFKHITLCLFPKILVFIQLSKKVFEKY